jgi:predicted NUDIX family phosphoesterase
MSVVVTKAELADRRLILAVAAGNLNFMAEQLGKSFIPIKQLQEMKLIATTVEPLIAVCEMLADLGIWFGPRRYLETDDNWRQLIPYVVLRAAIINGQKDTGEPAKYLVYRRGTGIEEQRLANRLAIGWGGHIDLPDCKFTEIDELSLKATVEASTERELLEECGMACRTQAMEVLGLIVSDDETGKYHVGLVMVLDCFGQVMSREDSQLELTWLTAEEIIEREGHEGWTSIVAEELARST